MDVLTLVCKLDALAWEFARTVVRTAKVADLAGSASTTRESLDECIVRCTGAREANS